jgi:RimJ/RimL family protein N-acetyltransferase
MTYIDKRGDPFSIKRYEAGDYTQLAEMYYAFTPKAKFQGMPPLEQEPCRKWIERLLDTGENFLAWRNDKVIGHAVFLPDLSLRDAEYLIFVNQNHRNRGVGTRLTGTALERAGGLGLKKLWLTVGAYNFIAIRLYRNFGFEFSDDSSESDRPMVLWL